MTLSILAAGIDSLYLSFAGRVDPALLATLDHLKAEASDEAKPVALAVETRPNLIVQPTGSGRYRFWLRCSDFDLLVTPSEKLPPGYARLSSIYLHSVGPERALAEVVAVVRRHLVAGSQEPEASRVDVYTDFQGWVPTEGDYRNFVTRARKNVEHLHDIRGYFDGRSFTGYQFGRDQLVARLYDKSREARESAKDAWLPAVWGDGYDPRRPVWSSSSS